MSLTLAPASMVRAGRTHLQSPQSSCLPLTTTIVIAFIPLSLWPMLALAPIMSGSTIVGEGGWGDTARCCNHHQTYSEREGTRSA